ncbi:hypothetical protein [Anaerovorax sp. IOR16]|uniref:hypothetical protein n=1 Tax=Anaerovorax sp. IOR16 TaxID=2773458 RepID=UPI0019D26357|nr:hypothetical protein [Anaerovorax sp. IOR16]
MKKIFILFLALMMIFTLVACTSNPSNKTDENKSSTTKNNLDWTLGYLNKDISTLRKEVSNGTYNNDFGQTLSYDYDGYTIYFSTTDEGSLKMYEEDFKRAGIDENAITSISLNLSNDLYDDETETIFRYPEINISGIHFGMDINELKKSNTTTDTYFVECYDNSCYAKDEIVGIQIESLKKLDVLNGKYASKFEMEPLDKNTTIKIVHLGMTKEELISILGTNYKEESYEDEFEEDGTYTSLIFDGITVGLNGKNHTANHLLISTNKISANLGFSVGDSALDVLEYCEEHYQPIKNPHGIENELLFGIYEIKKGIAVQLIFNKYGTINAIEDIKEDTVVQEIILLDPSYLYGI